MKKIIKWGIGISLIGMSSFFLATTVQASEQIIRQIPSEKSPVAMTRSVEFIRKSQLQDQVERGHLTQRQADAMNDWMTQFEEFCHEIAPNQNWRLNYTNMIARHNNHLLTIE
ncbi:MAG: hypothetical protein ACOYEB_06595 [Enterococcus lemanii]